MKLGSRAGVHLGRVAGGIKRVLVVFGQHLAMIRLKEPFGPLAQWRWKVNPFSSQTRCSTSIHSLSGISYSPMIRWAVAPKSRESIEMDRRMGSSELYLRSESL